MTLRHVASRDNPLLVRLRRQLRQPGGYRAAGQAWLEGDHLCRAALQRGRPPALIVATEAMAARHADLRDAAREVVIVPPALFAGLSTLESPAGLGGLLDLPAAAAPQPDVASVVLDGVQDAGNVGSILRSAAALGVRQVLALPGTAALWSPKVLRAGMGAHFAVALHTDAELTRVLAEFNGPAIVTSLDATQSLYALDLRQPCAFVFGNEGAGVSAPVLARASHPVRIPMPGVAESLNVAAAVAVCLFEQVRQRLPD